LHEECLKYSKKTITTWGTLKNKVFCVCDNQKILKQGDTQMVNSSKENSVKKAADQGISEKAREPAKIKANTRYELCDTHLTAFGGLLALVKFLDLVNFKEIFEIRYCSPKRKPELGCYHMIQGLLMLMFVGFTRLGHIEYIRRDPMICGILGVGILPAISTFWRYLASLCLNQSKAFLLIGADIRQRVWETCGLSYESVCINIDTTVSTVYGDIEGSRKGHNTKHRGKKGLRPIFMFLEETREYLCGTQRQGSTMSDGELAKLIREIHKYLPACIKKVIVRGDAEFIGGLTIAACRESGYSFIFGNKSCKPVFDAEKWYEWNTYGYNEAQYEPHGWGQPCRFVAMRIRKEQLGDRQYEIFEADEYKHRVFATNMTWTAHAVIVHYDKRATVEAAIKEAQQEGILAIPSKRFLTNHAYFQIVMLAYNMWRWIKLTAGVRPEENDAPIITKAQNATLANEIIVNHTIRIARLKMLFLPAKITMKGGKPVVKYSSHDARAAELLDFLAYLDKRKKQNRFWEDAPVTLRKQAG
jgi:hypothetical protein